MNYKHTRFFLLFFLLIFIFSSVSLAKSRSTFQVELLQNGDGARFMCLSNGEVKLELHPVGFKPAFAFPGRMLMKKEKTYPIDLEYLVGDHTVKENVNLEEYKKIERITFELKMENLRCKQEKDKIVFYDKKGKKKVYINSPYMKDMGDVNTDAVTLQLRKAGKQMYLDLVPYDEWLKDRSRVYSVKVVLPIGF